MDVRFAALAKNLAGLTKLRLSRFILLYLLRWFNHQAIPAKGAWQQFRDSCCPKIADGIGNQDRHCRRQFSHHLATDATRRAAILGGDGNGNKVAVTLRHCLHR